MNPSVFVGSFRGDSKGILRTVSKDAREFQGDPRDFQRRFWAFQGISGTFYMVSLTAFSGAFLGVSGCFKGYSVWGVSGAFTGISGSLMEFKDFQWVFRVHFEEISWVFGDVNSLKRNEGSLKKRILGVFKCILELSGCFRRILDYFWGLQGHF